MLILEEAAYCPPDFVFEVVMPLLIVGNTSLLAISTLTSSINFYTRLIRIKDPVTHKPVFTVLQIELCCEKCKNDGKAAECVHMLHLIPRWQVFFLPFRYFFGRYPDSAKNRAAAGTRCCGPSWRTAQT